MPDMLPGNDTMRQNTLFEPPVSWCQVTRKAPASGLYSARGKWPQPCPLMIVNPPVTGFPAASTKTPKMLPLPVTSR